MSKIAAYYSSLPRTAWWLWSFDSLEVICDKVSLSGSLPQRAFIAPIMVFLNSWPSLSIYASLATLSASSFRSLAILSSLFLFYLPALPVIWLPLFPLRNLREIYFAAFSCPPIEHELLLLLLFFLLWFSLSLYPLNSFSEFVRFPFLRSASVLSLTGISPSFCLPSEWWAFLVFSLL